MVTGSTVLPAVAGLLVAALVDRAARMEPWTASRGYLVALAAALAATQGAVALAVSGLAACARRLVAPGAGALRVRRCVPGILAVPVALAAAGLVDDALALA